MSMKESLKNIDFLVYLHDKVKETYSKHLISDEKVIRKIFRHEVGREINLKNPKLFNDKLQWLKLYWHDPLATVCADKYAVREFIAHTIGKEYLNEKIGIYESVDEIDIEALPESFVLKGTHGSGYNIICKDKRNLNWTKKTKKMKRWLWSNYHWRYREWIYKDIKPRIICEKYMEDESGKPPMDYKIYCFNGEPKLVLVNIDRFNNPRENFYDPNWTFLENVGFDLDNDKEINLPPPPNFEEMLYISRKLSERFPHVRVDLYNKKGRVIFGELTFFCSSGFCKFRDDKIEKKMGDWLQLPH